MTDEISEKEFEQVVLCKVLGRGQFGTVHVGLLPSGRFVAVKVLEVPEDTEFGKEIEFHKPLVHPNITRYLHSRVIPDSIPQQVHVYLEIVTGGSITSLLRGMPKPGLPISAVRVYSRHMFLGLEYLHKNKKAHRDVKGDNLLISMDTGIAKLADFDQAKVMQGGGTLRTAAANTLSGTPAWMAPEVIANDGGYDPFLADIWSAGCTVGEMITGSAPWKPEPDLMKSINKVVNRTGWPENIPRNAKALGSEDAFDFLDLCFQRDVKKRPKASVLLQHRFLDV